MKVLVQRLPHAEGLPLPTYATSGAAGMDLLAAKDMTVPAGGRALVPTGLCIALPEGFEMQVRPRSGLALKHGITVPNSPGTVDEDYRGEVGVILLNTGPEPFVVARGDRIAQAVFAPVTRAVWEEVVVLRKPSVERAASARRAASNPHIPPMDLDFTDDELHRYSRHILLKEVGAIGQAKLRAARVLLVGAGGLGSPLALYLAAAGVGTLGLVDHDALELSNLQRQVAHTTSRIGQNKTDSTAAALRDLNPEVRLELHTRRMDRAAAEELIPQYDVICDGTDNFPTRFLLGDACHLLKKPLVSAAVLRFEGQLSVFRAHEGPPHPCHRCLHPEMPPEGLVPTCSQAGVLGAVVGVMGTLQATEVLKVIMGIGEDMSGRLLLWDALDARFRTVKLRRDLECALCGESATIHDLSAHS